MTDTKDVAGGGSFDGANEGTTIPTGQPTVAAFSPNQATASHRRNQSSVLLHQKSPLLLATPPQVTRALAYSHPFILPLNHLIGLLSWTTDDYWESFLLLSSFWFVVLYGDIITRFAGPLVLITSLIVGMFARRYSPLSSANKKSGKAGKRGKAGTDNTDSRKSIDEMLDTLQTFTNRCNVLLDPLLSLTEFLSTQTTAVASTTRPALTTMFIRLLLVLPIWYGLTLPPLKIITTQRVVLVVGTLVLSWHSGPARVTRAILWRSRLIRYLFSLVTGLTFAAPAKANRALAPSTKTAAASKSSNSTGLRFTFAIYENQRRWLGLGWTPSLLSYERQAWTDEQLNTAAEPDQFVLPETDQEGTEWQWVEDSEWHVEGVDGDTKSAHGDEDGWTYYDSKWQGARGADGWGRYTRHRKWVRDAELVDLARDLPAPASTAVNASASSSSSKPKGKRVSWFGRRRTEPDKSKIVDKGDAASASGVSAETARSRDGPEDDVHTPIRFRQREWEREIGEGLAEGLG